MSSEQTFVGTVTAVWATSAGAHVAREVTVAPLADSFDDISFYVFAKDCHWQVGDEVEIVLRKKTKETTHD